MSRDDAAQVASLFGAVRVGLGVWLLVGPRWLPQLLGVDSRTATRTRWLARMVGGREVAVGVATLAAGRSGDLAAALAPQLVADLGDVLGLGLALRAGDVNRLTGFLGFAAALGGVLVEANGMLAAG
jgi:peptide-methionine (R)-S-oxide reductase